MEDFTQRDFLMLIIGIIVSSFGYIFKFYFFERKKRELELKNLKFEQIEKLQSVFMTKELHELIQNELKECNVSSLEIKADNKYSNEEKSIRISSLERKYENINNKISLLSSAYKTIFEELQK